MRDFLFILIICIVNTILFGPIIGALTPLILVIVILIKDMVSFYLTNIFNKRYKKSKYLDNLIKNKSINQK